NKAAEQGHPEAQHSLGSYYTFGNSGKTDEGLKWLRKSANQGHVKAMFALGCYYDDAIVRTPKFEEAAEWYAKAAERNYPPAQKYLSNMYAQGEGVSQSWQKAYFWGCLSVRCFERTPAPVNPYVMSYPSRDHTDPMEAEKHLSRTDIETIRREASKWEPRTETR
ncbi:MAG: sel1 repeat family protein, partial [Alphaproteobacteria bacterium]